MVGCHKYFVTCALFTLLVTSNLPAQDLEDTQAFPADPSQWINSAPLSKESLKGKAAFLWFFEETCPRCRAKWPEMIAISKKYEGKPIVFIAVNSGNPRQVVEQYARGVGLPWPIIVDPTRQFESACGIPEISLQNIYQVLLLTPSGKLESGNSSNLEPTIEAALQGAKWHVDIAGIDPSLMSAWQAVEIGNFPAAAASIKRGLKSSKDEVKTAATALNDYVKTQMQALIDQQSATDDWSKYKLSRTMNERFAGYEIPPEIAGDAKRLGNSPAVKSQIQAFRQLGTIQASLRSDNPQVLASALQQLQKLIEKSPDTDAAQEAAKLARKIQAAMAPAQ